MKAARLDLSATRVVLGRREYDVLREAINDSITDDPRFVHLSPVQKPKRRQPEPSKLLAAVRASIRVYLITNYGLKAAQLFLATVSSRRSRGPATPRKPLVAHPQRMALSLATMLFLHRYLYAFFTALRSDMLDYSKYVLPSRWARQLYDCLTWRVTPAIGASLSGLALGIYPSSPLRVTVALYALVRAGELSFKSAELAGYLRTKPKWVGSWILAALAHGQLLHAFVFDPESSWSFYGDFMLNNTSEYVQQRPTNLPQVVGWPSKRDVVDSLAEMARLRWPPYISPILRPKDLTTLPASIDPIISPITSRAHPALQHLSCALLHPSDTSCLPPFLRQVLLSFSSIGKALTAYYGALSLLRVSRLIRNPPEFLAHLMTQILRTTAYLLGAIATSWGSICFFNNYLPRTFIPKFRIFLGGVLGGSLAIIDRTPTGHLNNMYAVRNSLGSLWKVGVKRRWWRSIMGGDVLIFVAALAAMNVLYDTRQEVFAGDQSKTALRVLRGDIEIGLKDKDELDI